MMISTKETRPALQAYPLCHDWRKQQKRARILLSAVAIVLHLSVHGQTAHKQPNEVAMILGVQAEIEALHQIQVANGSGPRTLEEFALRQKISDEITSANLDVDSVIAEISSEQSSLGEVKAELQERQQKKVNRLTTAALLTGSALGAAVSATQFSTLGNRTQNIGDAVGIGSGVASTVLSVLSTRAQNGSSSPVGNIPNMLAPLLDDSTPALHTYYPPAVIAFLRAVPQPGDGKTITRLELLEASWKKADRLSNRAAMTTSGDTLRLSSGDLDNRIAMLADVRSRVSLMKRDLATLMHEALIQ